MLSLDCGEVAPQSRDPSRPVPPTQPKQPTEPLASVRSSPPLLALTTTPGEQLMRNQVKRVQTRRSFHRRRGAVIILFAMLLTVVAAVLAFSIDVGYMANVRSELQNAVDAGALAGAGALQEDASTANAAAIQYIQQNRVGNRPVSSDSVEVSAGVWNDTTRTFTAGGEFPNAFRVEVVDRDQPLFFGRMLNKGLFDVQARATAVYQPRDIVVVLDLSTSMNNDSELASISSLGETAVLDNLAEIYDDFGAPVFGNLQPDPVYIESTDTNEILAQLGLTGVDYPYSGGSWSEFVQYVRDDSTVNSAGYGKKYGYPTLMQYWLAKRPLAVDTPDLWMASANPSRRSRIPSRCCWPTSRKYKVTT